MKIRHDELSDIAIYHEGTGEHLGYLTYKEYLDYLRGKTSAPKMNNPNAWKNTNVLKIYIDETCGDFYFNYYNKTIDKKYLFRFMYLCTYMNYSNYIEFGNCKGDGKLVSKRDLKEILGLKDQQFYDTVNYLFEEEMIMEDEDGYIKVNPMLCNKGKMKKGASRYGVVRMFNNAIQELYRNSNKREHEKIGLLIKLLPHVNYKWNIVCSNPNESDIRLIKPLKQKEICEILEIDKKTLASIIKITILNGQEGAMVKVSNAFVKNAYVMNPRFMYMAKDKETIANLLQWFSMGKNVIDINS